MKQSHLICQAKCAVSYSSYQEIKLFHSLKILIATALVNKSKYQEYWSYCVYFFKEFVTTLLAAFHDNYFVFLLCKGCLMHLLILGLQVFVIHKTSGLPFSVYLCPEESPFFFFF